MKQLWLEEALLAQLSRGVDMYGPANRGVGSYLLCPVSISRQRTVSCLFYIHKMTINILNRSILSHTYLLTCRTMSHEHYYVFHLPSTTPTIPLLAHLSLMRQSHEQLQNYLLKAFKSEPTRNQQEDYLEFDSVNQW
jgi:hypothetical protein